MHIKMINFDAGLVTYRRYKESLYKSRTNKKYVILRHFIFRYRQFYQLFFLSSVWNKKNVVSIRHEHA